VIREVNDRTTSLVSQVDTGLDPEVNALLAPFPEIAGLARTVYTPNGVRLFMTSPTPRFDGRTALDRLVAGEVQRVVSALAADCE
jgi:hypothetical protein